MTAPDLVARVLAVGKARGKTRRLEALRRLREAVRAAIRAEGQPGHCTECGYKRRARKREDLLA